MTTIAFVGDNTTTTSLAVAASWPVPTCPLLVELDPSGGSLAAWQGMPVNPSLSTIVAASRAVADGLRRDAPAGAPGGVCWSTLEPRIRVSPQGIRFIPAPIRSLEAGRAVEESCKELLPGLAASAALTALLDIGRIVPAAGIPRAALGATAIVVCHRQAAASPEAAAVRLQRLVETVELLARLGVPPTVALIGSEPYDGGEVLALLTEAVPALGGGGPCLVELPVDPLAAAVLAGRSGVSARRFARLPLMRAARTLAEQLATLAGDASGDPIR
jgi:hypothetical protein